MKRHCDNKRKYPNIDIAIEMAHWKYINEKVNLSAYECPSCSNFHLTSKYCDLRHLHNEWEAGRDFYTVTREQIKRHRKNVRKRLKKSVDKVISNS